VLEQSVLQREPPLFLSGVEALLEALTKLQHPIE
jgi:hypothetical protein